MFRFRRRSIAEQVSSSLQNPTEGQSERIEKQQSVAEQVSSSLKNPSDYSEPEVIQPVPDKSDSSQESKPDESDSNANPQEDLPSLEECLYGSATRRSPLIPEDGDSPENNDGSDVFSSIDDIGLNSRWSQDSDVSTDLHDIDVALLRKLCSQGSGIPEEEGPRGDKTRGTCHRGVAWRVLLEQLPVRDIHKTWPKSLPPKRKLYREMVEKYMEDAVDPGSHLKGESHWEQSLRMNNNISSNGSPTNGANGGSGGNGINSSVNIRATEDIYGVFPQGSKYKEIWRKLGISLNQGESAAAIGMNRLRVPVELLSSDTENDAQQMDPMEDEHQSVENESTYDTMKIEAPANEGNGRNDDVFEQFCKDAKLLSEIRKDVVRTNPHLRFYLETRNRLGVRRHAALERVLFVWAKLNGNLYVQGMNEIVGTIYYVLAMDPTPSSGNSIENRSDKQHFWADNAEADTYFLFDSLLNKMEVRDVFVADLDHDSDSGLHARIKNIEMLLKEHDPEIFNHLKGSLGLDPSFYAIRWLTTLLSREFRLPDTIRLWDSLLASTHKENFLRYVCASMVMAIRDRLLRGDFGTCLKLLQNYPSGEIGMDELLESSRALWIYETQISLACQKGGLPLRQALNMISAPEGVIMAFGRRGGKPPRLSEQIRKAVTPNTGIKNIVSPASATAAPALTPNTTKSSSSRGLMGRLWAWRTPPTEKTIINVEDIDLSKIEAAEDDNSEEWDLIDKIIDGKTEFVAGSMRSSISNISDSSPLRSKESMTPPTTPGSSPQRTSDDYKPSDSLYDNNDVVEDYSNNDESFSYSDPL